MEDSAPRQKSFAGLYILLTVILMLQLFNIFVGFGSYVGVTNNREPVTTKRPIPGNIGGAYKEQLIIDFLQSWNDKDAHSLYSIMGKLAQSQLDFEKFKNQCKQSFVLGKIENAVFINHEFVSKYFGSDIINLYYAVSLESQPARLTLSIIDSAGEPGVMRFDVQTNP